MSAADLLVESLDILQTRGAVDRLMLYRDDVHMLSATFPPGLGDDRARALSLFPLVADATRAIHVGLVDVRIGDDPTEAVLYLDLPLRGSGDPSITVYPYVQGATGLQWGTPVAFGAESALFGDLIDHLRSAERSRATLDTPQLRLAVLDALDELLDLPIEVEITEAMSARIDSLAG